jgi:hypothetical protein
MMAGGMVSGLIVLIIELFLTYFIGNNSANGTSGLFPSNYVVKL